MLESVSDEFRGRVKRLRLMRRWHQSELAARAGTSTTAISQIERGRVEPTPEQIAGIANALGYTPEFLTSELKLVPTTRPWLRAYADASRREADGRTSATTIAAEYVRRLNLRPLPDAIPLFDRPVDDDDEIEEIATELRLFADIEPDAVVTNAIRAAERLGCVVIPLESELGRHLGMSVRADDIPIVCVAKADLPGERQRWTVAHEIGHLALHGRAAPPGDAREATRLERQAHRFAAAFLGPGDALIDTLNEVGGRVTLRALTEVKAVWGISVKSLVGRFQSLGVIDTEHARSLYKQISARKWSKDEPVDVPIESAQWLERTLLRKAQANDLATASALLASTIGANALDLFELADWTPRPDAKVLSLAERRQRQSA